jgi:hypothetical protein
MEDVFTKYTKGRMIIQSKGLEKYSSKAVCLLYMESLRSDEYTRSTFDSSRVIDILSIDDDELFERQYKMISLFGRMRWGKTVKRMHYDKNFHKDAKNEYRALKEELFSAELSSMSIYETKQALNEGTLQHSDTKVKKHKKRVKKKKSKISLDIHAPAIHGAVVYDSWELSGDSTDVSATIQHPKARSQKKM